MPVLLKTRVLVQLVALRLTIDSKQRRLEVCHHNTTKQSPVHWRRCRSDGKSAVCVRLSSWSKLVSSSGVFLSITLAHVTPNRHIAYNTCIPNHDTYIQWWDYWPHAKGLGNYALSISPQEPTQIYMTLTICGWKLQPNCSKHTG